MNPSYVSCEDSPSLSNSLDISVHYQNFSGVRTKLHLLRENIPLFHYNTIILMETWLNSDFLTYELGFINHDVFRCDKSNLTSANLRGEVC